MKPFQVLAVMDGFVCLFRPKNSEKRAERWRYYDKPKYVTQSNVPQKKSLVFTISVGGSNSCQFFASVLSLGNLALDVQSLEIKKP